MNNLENSSIVSPLELTLSQLFREKSKEAHQQTESHSFIQKLFKGDADSNEYVDYLWALKEMYTALEKALISLQGSKTISLIYFPQLFRLNSLESDLFYWNKKGSRSENKKLKEIVDQYTNYIKLLSLTRADCLVSHAYVRYLGDLSGGQILGKVLKQKYGCDEGLSFYEYPDLNIAEEKTRYRNALDAIGNIRKELISDLCNETILAFEYNGKIFQALNKDLHEAHSSSV